MRGIFVFIITLLIIVPTYGLSLDEAVSAALEHNPDILAAQKWWEAVKSKAIKVSTWPDPQIELMYEQIPQSGGSLDDASMKMYGLSQMIPFPGKLTLKRRKAEDAAKIAEEKFRAKKREIVAKVKSAFYKLFFVDKSIQINSENKDLLKKFARIAEAKYVVNKATQHDVLKAQIEHSLLVNELITLEQKRQTARARLNTLLNRETDASIDTPAEIAVPEFAHGSEVLEKLALESRPELKAMEYGLKMSENAHTLAKMEYLPNFKVKLLQREMRTMGRDGWNLGFMMDVPLWFWKEASGVSEAGARREEAEAAYNNMKNMVRFEVQEAYVRVDSAKRSAELFENEIIPQVEQALKSAVVAYESERVDFLTLLNSQKTLLESKLKNYGAFRDLGVSLAELERVVGKDLNEQAPRFRSGQGGN
jgi:outer membrane protein TolC